MGGDMRDAFCNVSAFDETAVGVRSFYVSVIDLEIAECYPPRKAMGYFLTQIPDLAKYFAISCENQAQSPEEASLP